MRDRRLTVVVPGHGDPEVCAAECPYLHAAQESRACILSGRWEALDTRRVPRRILSLRSQQCVHAEALTVGHG
jgi:hypothetical protein